jgi:hypothetical protein
MLFLQSLMLSKLVLKQPKLRKVTQPTKPRAYFCQMHVTQKNVQYTFEAAFCSMMARA